MSEFKSIDDMDSEQQRFTFAVADFLRSRGWRSTCMNPASLWLWEKTMEDGRTLLVDRDTALAFVRHAGDEP